MHDRSFPEELAEAVRERRKQLRLLQVELAELAGCSTRFINTLEAAKASLRLDKVESVLQVLGLRLEVRLPSEGASNPKGHEA